LYLPNKNNVVLLTVQGKKTQGLTVYTSESYEDLLQGIQLDNLHLCKLEGNYPYCFLILSAAWIIFKNPQLNFEELMEQLKHAPSHIDQLETELIQFIYNNSKISAKQLLIKFQEAKSLFCIPNSKESESSIASPRNAPDFAKRGYEESSPSFERTLEPTEKFGISKPSGDFETTEHFKTCFPKEQPSLATSELNASETLEYSISNELSCKTFRLSDSVLNYSCPTSERVSIQSSASPVSYRDELKGSNPFIYLPEDLYPTMTIEDINTPLESPRNMTVPISDIKDRLKLPETMEDMDFEEESELELGSIESSHNAQSPYLMTQISLPKSIRGSIAFEDGKAGACNCSCQVCSIF